MAFFVTAERLVNQVHGYEPQRQNNFGIQIDGLAGGKLASEEITLALDTAFAPVVRNEEIALPYGNEVVFAAGRAVPEPGALVVRDFVDRQIAAILVDWRKQVYDDGTGAVGFAAEYKKTGYIFLFASNSTDGQPNKLRKWRLDGLWPLHINPAANGLTMNAAGALTIEMSLRFDKASFEISG